MKTSHPVPRVAFLGICERFSKVRNIDPRLSALNLLGLRTQVVSPIYPMPVSSMSLVFALYYGQQLPTFKITGLSQDGNPAFWITGDFRRYEIDTTDVEPTSPVEMALAATETWLPIVVPFPENFRVILAPGRYTLCLEENGDSAQIGVLDFLLAPVPPLTEDRIAAIRSDPNASKVVRMRFECNKCHDGINAYSALERSDRLEKEGNLWYREVPDEFVCSCRSTKMDLRILRENMHVLLGEKIYEDSENLSLIALYERSTIEAIVDKFNRLLARNPEEPEMQTFLQETPLVFHRFTPARILTKPPIFNKFVADFGILSRSGEFYLIEIEKPGKRLLNKDGSRSSDFNHASDQVRDWLHVFQDDRDACLKMMDLSNDDVTAVQGVFIMGRDTNCPAKQLRKLKSADMGPVKFLTYDDLLTGLGALASKMREV